LLTTQKQANLERYGGDATIMSSKILNSSVLSWFLNVKNVSAERVWTPKEFQTVGLYSHDIT